ncbi:putative 28S ribosomal protein S6, mitochondrial-like [Apostichopus japonicus]|uniref:Small ribosomal subunit protein bS6m n=1 Tax=Stichopus japonicus TaxID=307972 RepID=A0A2G8KY23_STIJA|nr:putative 28S ribosomal protein S6, mitochondrial-like [Apostichopus japonicus]
MPGYELSLIMKVLHGPELRDAVRRSLTFILENGGIIRKLEYLGEKRLPYRMRAHNENFVNGRYFVVDFHAPTSILPVMHNYFKREIDIIRPSMIRQETEAMPTSKPCEGVFEDIYQPKQRKLLHTVQNQLKDIKL